MSHDIGIDVTITYTTQANQQPSSLFKYEIGDFDSKDKVRNALLALLCLDINSGAEQSPICKMFFYQLSCFTFSIAYLTRCLQN